MDVDLDTMEDRVELRSDEANELFFKITVEGADRAPDVIRLVCEHDDVMFAFRGQPTLESGVLRFVIPAMKSMVKPGVQYDTSIEVLVENKYFVPVKFKSEFKQPMRVVAEAVKRIEETPSSDTKRTIVQPAQKEKIEVKASPVKATTLRELYRQKKTK